VLLPRKLDTGDMRLSAIDGLTLLESRKRSRAGCRLDLEYRIGQVFVKPSAFNYSDTLQIMFKQQIEVVGVVGLRAGLPISPCAALFD